MGVETEVGEHCSVGCSMREVVDGSPIRSMAGPAATPGTAVELMCSIFRNTHIISAVVLAALHGPDLKSGCVPASATRSRREQLSIEQRQQFAALGVEWATAT
ncbi:hypothetical protein OG770_36800 [Streptomyces sp. NBC_01185]|nr:hypothetical protein OG770_36800 [Streptomyces sp. NBC_01185]